MSCCAEILTYPPLDFKPDATSVFRNRKIISLVHCGHADSRNTRSRNIHVSFFNNRLFSLLLRVKRHLDQRHFFCCTCPSARKKCRLRTYLNNQFHVVRIPAQGVCQLACINLCFISARIILKVLRFPGIIRSRHRSVSRRSGIRS